MDSPASEGLTKVSAILPLIASIISGLGERFNSDNVDVVANPDLIDLEAAKLIFGYLAHWSSQPETIQFLASLPQERSLLDAQYEYMQRRFSEISLYPSPSPWLQAPPLPWIPTPFPLPLPPPQCQLPWLLVAVLKNLLEQHMPLVLARLVLPANINALLRHASTLSHRSPLRLLHGLESTSSSWTPSLITSGSTATESSDSSYCCPNWPSFQPTAYL